MDWIKRYFRRRRVVKRLVAFAKTPKGFDAILKMNDDNHILACIDLCDLGCETAVTVKTRIPNETWRVLNASKE